MVKKSKKAFSPTERHMEILNEIGKNKVIALKTLYSSSSGKVSYSQFTRVLKLLESHDLVKSMVGHRKIKYFFLTKKGASYSKYKAPHAVSMARLGHDIAASNILSKLLAEGLFQSGYIPSRVPSSTITPDIITKTNRPGRQHAAAVEVELTQKSSARIIDKFIRYEESNEFDLVLYLTQNKAIFEFYTAALGGLVATIQDKVIIGLTPETEQNLSQCSCWHRGALHSLEKILESFKK